MNQRRFKGTREDNGKEVSLIATWLERTISGSTRENLDKAVPDTGWEILTDTDAVQYISKGIYRMVLEDVIIRSTDLKAP